MARNEFSVETKRAAEHRANGHCENCGLPFSASNPIEYDHEIPDGLGGSNELENCQALGKCCHSPKTHKVDRPMMAKADRLRKKRLNQTPAKRKWPSKNFRGEINWNR